MMGTKATRSERADSLQEWPAHFCRACFLSAFRRSTPSDYPVEYLAQFRSGRGHGGLRQFHGSVANNGAEQPRGLQGGGSAEARLLNTHRAATVFFGDHSHSEREEGVR